MRQPFFVEKLMAHVILVNHHRRKVMSFFSTKKTNIFYGAKLIFRSFATFLGRTIFDQVPNKGFYLLTAGQFGTILQEFRLWGS